ncbi:GumC family protein [Silvibacterium acidisoli]|uniref:GumC family protein n=1 Tax=Acidobacteriaceae bacterium ZG23-2 TaxID=2883246 RepID=UPI00406C3AFE
MLPPTMTEFETEAGSAPVASTDWAVRGMLLWSRRKTLARVAAIGLILGLLIAFSIPKQYKSTARIMPPDQQSGSGAMMLAALASRSTGLGGLGTLASMLGGRTTTALFISLLRSGTVSGELIDRFQLLHVYHKRYRVDAAKRLASRTSITDDKKSGVITIEVVDTDPVRARDLTLAYLDGLNKLVTETSTSSARRERIFIEQRLHSVERDLEQAQVSLSEFSSKTNAIDIKEQTRAMVDAGAKVEGELLVEQSGLQSLRQIYGDGNIRVRETEARIASLKAELNKMAGSSAAVPSGTSDEEADKGELYPPLRQIPRLAVPYADLYRKVRVQETVFELLTQQYEMARIDEARDIPVVSVIDAPGIAEKKSFPPRLIVALALTFLTLLVSSALIILEDSWSRVDPLDPRKRLAAEVSAATRRRTARWKRR